MIGNDIIDLSQSVLSYSPHRRKRWLQKIASSEELSLLKNWPEQLWPDILWAIKESVFKCQSRQQYSTKLIPHHIVLTSLHPADNGNAHGEVHFGSNSYYVRLHMSDELIHASASSTEDVVSWHWIKWGQIFDADDQSTLLRKKFLDHLQNQSDDIWHLSSNQEGLPIVSGPNGDSDKLSFSHHGQFGAWAYLPSHLFSFK